VTPERAGARFETPGSLVKHRVASVVFHFQVHGRFGAASLPRLDVTASRIFLAPNGTGFKPPNVCRGPAQQGVSVGDLISL
jgi:hypothetical protein